MREVVGCGWAIPGTRGKERVAWGGMVEGVKGWHEEGGGHEGGEAERDWVA